MEEKILKRQIDYWKKSAQKNLDAAEVLFNNKHYDGSLFFCHLALEKLLKGLYVKKNKKSAPYIHDLTKLANLSGLELSEEQIEKFRIITIFNIAGRYVEDKRKFYQRCTKDYTKKYLIISKDIFLWLKKQYLKK